MAISDLLPWKRGEKIPVRRLDQEETSLPTLRREMNRLFDDF